MRIYIAGPMTGLPNNNRDAFVYAWKELTEAGFEAVSPHFLESSIPETLRRNLGLPAVYRQVLPIDIFALSTSDAVLALPAWEGSKGAHFEYHYCNLCMIPWIGGHKHERESGKGNDIALYIVECIEKLKELAIAQNSYHT